MAICSFDKCSENTDGDSALCILHLDFPKEDDQRSRAYEMKSKKGRKRR